MYCIRGAICQLLKKGVNIVPFDGCLTRVTDGGPWETNARWHAWRFWPALQSWTSSRAWLEKARAISPTKVGRCTGRPVATLAQDSGPLTVSSFRFTCFTLAQRRDYKWQCGLLAFIASCCSFNNQHRHQGTGTVEGKSQQQRKKMSMPSHLCALSSCLCWGNGAW